MNKIEIETITTAMVTKQSWVRKELDDFLDVWEKITKEKISGHNTFVLYEYNPDEDYPTTYRLCLRRGINQIDGDVYHSGWCSFDNYLDVSTMSIFRVRKIIRHIYSGLSDYFKNIQNDIGNLDKESQQISDIIAKLSS